MSIIPIPTAPLEAQTASQQKRQDLRARFDSVRSNSLVLTAPLTAEDQCVQAMPDASSTKWHLAHTSWFFEVAVLQTQRKGYAPYDVRLHRLFNSYYDSLGPQHPRPQRGLLTRPSLDEVWKYRLHVDLAIRDLIDEVPDEHWPTLVHLIELGLAHEEQHQELIVTDAMYLLSCNPLEPAAFPHHVVRPVDGVHLSWDTCPGGIYQIGHQGPDFCFDNEAPAHSILLEPFAMASRPVSVRDYLGFIEDGGYDKPEYWLSDGWVRRKEEHWHAPLYWSKEANGTWSAFGVRGRQALDLNAPVCHISYYEADAYAKWAKARLPTEFEWEAWARANAGTDRPQATLPHGIGAVWEWTRSAYEPYPRYRPWEGALAEYNSKFMIGQQVLRGASVATPKESVRLSYRNFFPPQARWQFTGLRLALHL